MPSLRCSRHLCREQGKDTNVLSKRKIPFS
nr:MAG TPA: hypothetical protein [Caudoviricetes sp.]